jgi:mannose-6-phosphate isomerase-like protein (cupin superfamily)
MRNDLFSSVVHLTGSVNGETTVLNSHVINSGDVHYHDHDFYEIYFFLGGNVEYFVDGEKFKLSKGDLLLINPMQLHQPITSVGNVYERIVLWIDRNYLAKLCK